MMTRREFKSNRLITTIAGQSGRTVWRLPSWTGVVFEWLLDAKSIVLLDSISMESIPSPVAMFSSARLAQTQIANYSSSMTMTMMTKRGRTTFVESWIERNPESRIKLNVWLLHGFRRIKFNYGIWEMAFTSRCELGNFTQNRINIDVTGAKMSMKIEW